MTAKLFVANGLATSAFTYDPATLALDTETITYTIPGQSPFTRVSLGSPHCNIFV